MASRRAKRRLQACAEAIPAGFPVASVTGVVADSTALAAVGTAVEMVMTASMVRWVTVAVVATAVMGRAVEWALPVRVEELTFQAPQAAAAKREAMASARNAWGALFGPACAHDTRPAQGSVGNLRRAQAHAVAECEPRIKSPCRRHHPEALRPVARERRIRHRSA